MSAFVAALSGCGLPWEHFVELDVEGAVQIITDTGARCSGELVTNSWVLTSRSCMAAAARATVRSGGRPGWPLQTSEVVERIPSLVGDYDAALLRLATPLLAGGTSSGFAFNTSPLPENDFRGDELRCRGQSGAAGEAWEERVRVTATSPDHLTVKWLGPGGPATSELRGAGCFYRLAHGADVEAAMVIDCDAEVGPRSCVLLATHRLQFWLAEARLRVELQERAGGQCLQLPRRNGAPDPDGTLEVAPCGDEQVNQQWRLLERGNGQYVLRSLEPSADLRGRCLLRRSDDNGAPIEQGDCHPEGADAVELLWRPVSSGDSFVIRGERLDQCLDPSPAEGPRLAPCSPTFTWAQRYEAFVHVEPGSHFLFHERSGLCGDLADASGGGNLGSGTCARTPRQLFTLEPLEHTVAFYLHVAQSPGGCLELAPDGPLLGNLLHRAPCAEGIHQRFLLKYLLGAEVPSFWLRPLQTDRCLDLPTPWNVPGAEVQTFTCTADTSQFWRLGL